MYESDVNGFDCNALSYLTAESKGKSQSSQELFSAALQLRSVSFQHFKKKGKLEWLKWDYQEKVAHRKQWFTEWKSFST